MMMRIKSLISTLIILISLFSYANPQNTCSGLFRSKISNSELSITALFQLIPDEYGWDILKLSHIFFEPESNQRVLIFKTLSKLTFEKDIMESELDRTVQSLYEIIIPPPPSSQKKTPKDLAEEYKRQNEILYLKQIYREAFRDLGLIEYKKPSEYLKRLREKHPIAETLLFTSIINTITITYFSFLSHFPSFLFSKTKRIPKELIEKIKSNNQQEAAIEELRHLGWDKATIDHTWRTAGKTYFYLMRTVSIFMFLQVLPVLKYSFMDYYMNHYHSADSEVEVFNADQYRFEQLESWRKAFLLLEGRLPDPDQFEQDREELTRVQENIEKTIQDRIQFNAKNRPKS